MQLRKKLHIRKAFLLIMIPGNMFLLVQSLHPSILCFWDTVYVGVMSGAIIYIKKDLNISEVQEEVLVGILSIISLLGSLAGGKTSDAVGRKWTIALAAIVFQSGALIMTLAPSFEILMIGRLLAGVGIGFGVMIAPVYIAEIAPSVTRESPRWLVMQNRIEEARYVLAKTNGTAREVEDRLGEIQVAAGLANVEKYESKAVWHEILSPTPAVQKMLIAGCGIQCFQQITVVSAISVAFVHHCIPETKGKSLEQIEMMFQSGEELQGGEIELGDAERLVQKQ